MKFIIDENLTPDLAQLFRSMGLDAHHVNEIKAHKKQRVKDDQLRRLALRKGYILITMDDDFVKSFVDRKVPEKLVYVFGLGTKEALLSRFKTVLKELPTLLQTHEFIEINRETVRFPFSE